MHVFLYKTLFILIFFVASSIYANEKGAGFDSNTNHVIIDDSSSQATCIVMTGESDRAFVSCNSTNDQLTPKYIYQTACQTFDHSNYFNSIYHLHIVSKFYFPKPDKKTNPL